MSNQVELWRPNCTRVCSNCCRSKCICPKVKKLKRSRYSNITDEEAEVMFDKGFDEGTESVLWYPDNTRWTL